MSPTSKPKAKVTVERNQTSIRGRIKKKKPWENPDSVAQFSGQQSEQCVIMIQAAFTGQKVRLDQNIRILCMQFIWLEVGVMPVWRLVCRGVDEAFTGLMRLALQDALGWVQAQVHHRGETR